MNRLFALLFLGLVLIPALSCTHQNNSGSAGYKNIKQEEFLQLQQQPNTLVMDVRTPGEVASGIIKGTSVFADYNGGVLETVLKDLDTSKTYLVYCRSGARSSHASRMMILKGFRKVYNLEGGINDWRGEIVIPE
jgi:rhodanese-related sulfurtransferase